MNNLYQKISQKIKSGQVQIKPRWHFVLKNIATIMLFLVIFLVALTIASALFFLFDLSDITLFGGLGVLGISKILSLTPWLVIISLISMLLLVLYIGKYFEAVRKKPLFYSFLILLASLIVFGSLTANAKIHRRILEQSYKNRFPIVGPYYQKCYQEKPLVGKIQKIDGEKISVKVEEKNYLVLISDKTKIPHRYIPEEGDLILIVGQPNGQEIEALGITKINPRKQRLRPLNF